MLHNFFGLLNLEGSAVRVAFALTTALTLVGMLGCGGAQLTPEAARVEWYTDRPDGDWQMLGDLQCQRGHNFVSAGSNVSYCRNTLRNRAAEMGADIIVVSSEQIGMGECGNCVLFVGTAYRQR